MFSVVELYIPIKCDSCNFQIHSKVFWTVNGQKCLTLKDFCPSREKGLHDIPELKQLITQLFHEVNKLCYASDPCSKNLEEFIINKFNGCNLRALNLIIYNI